MKSKKKFPIMYRPNKFTFFLIVSLLVLVWLGVVMRRELARKQEMNGELAALEASIEKTQKENEELSKKIAYLKDEKNIEREARERLNLKKPDERVAIIVPPKNESQDGAGETGQQSARANIFKKLLNILVEIGKNLTE